MSWFKIFSAVVVGNIVSWVIISLVGLFFWLFIAGATLEAFSEKASNTSKMATPSSITSGPPKMPSKSANQVPIGALSSQSSSKPKADESKTSASAIRTNRQMCEFWAGEHRREPTAQNEAYRDNACSRYRESLN